MPLIPQYSRSDILSDSMQYCAYTLARTFHVPLPHNLKLVLEQLGCIAVQVPQLFLIVEHRCCLARILTSEARTPDLKLLEEKSLPFRVKQNVL